MNAQTMSSRFEPPCLSSTSPGFMATGLSPEPAQRPEGESQVHSPGFLGSASSSAGLLHPGCPLESPQESFNSRYPGLFRNLILRVRVGQHAE